MTNDLFQGYQSVGSSDDEMFDDSGAFRDEYRDLGTILQGWVAWKTTSYVRNARISRCSAQVSRSTSTRRKKAQSGSFRSP